MPKQKDWDGKLDKVTESKTDAKFLKQLAKWLFSLSGNVNAAQRLNVIAINQHYGDRTIPR